MPLQNYATAIPGHSNHDAKREDSFYTKGASSRESWYGFVSDEEDMPEEDVRNFIKYGNPGLYEQLRQLPFSSRDISMSFYGRRRLNQLNLGQVDRSWPLKNTTNQVRPASAQARCASPNLDQLIREHRQQTESKLKGGYVWRENLNANATGDDRVCCFTECLLSSEEQSFSCYHVLHRPDYPDSGEIPCFSFCEYCINSIFAHSGNAQRHHKNISRAPAQLLLDGVEQPIVLEAAYRVYPDINAHPCTSKKERLDGKGNPDCAFRHPSNSSRNRTLRSHKLYEIDQSLKEVAKYEKAVSKVKNEPQKRNARELSPELTVIDALPAYIEPANERYKKQGITGFDKQKYGKELQLALPKEQHDTNVELSSSDKLPVHLQERYCYCCEVDGGTEMLRCSAELCPIGWFHLRCTELGRLPAVDERFFCCYCSNSDDKFVIRSLFEHESSGWSEPQTPVNPQFVKAAPAQQLHVCDDDTEETLQGYDWSSEVSRTRQKVIEWRATNDRDIWEILSESPFAKIGSEDGYSTASARASSAPAQCHSPSTRIVHLLEDCSGKSSAMIDVEASWKLPAASFAVKTQVTPPFQPTEPIPKPWGTPINVSIPGLAPSDSTSPSKRKDGKIEGCT